MNNTTFKRLNVGDKFISNCLTSGFRGTKFRKHNKTQGIKLNEEGRGDTANPTSFTRSHACSIAN